MQTQHLSAEGSGLSNSQARTPQTSLCRHFMLGALQAKSKAEAVPALRSLPSKPAGQARVARTHGPRAVPCCCEPSSLSPSCSTSAMKQRTERRMLSICPAPRTSTVLIGTGSDRDTGLRLGQAVGGAGLSGRCSSHSPSTASHPNPNGLNPHSLKSWRDNLLGNSHQHIKTQSFPM